MIRLLRRSVFRNLVSPYGIALIPCFLFLFAWLFPPSAYTRLMLEPDLMYHNFMVLGFFAACVGAFLLGVRFRGHFQRASSALELPRIHLRSGTRLVYLLVPLLLAGVPCLTYMLLIARSINFVALILSKQGNVMKEAITGGEASGYWGSTLFLLTSVLWWAAFRAGQIDLKGTSKRIFRVVFLICFAIDFMTCLATFDRTNLMPLLAGLTVIYVFIHTRGARVRPGKLALTSFLSVFAIVGAFVALQFARGASRLDGVIANMLGYTIASYNRLAALLLGVMHYVYQGKGGYLAAFLTENDRFHGVREQMGLPTSYGLWLSEFPALQASGLSPSYNWASVFGYLFSDLGWWTPLYMFAAGILARFLWSRFRAGTTIGIVLYPWMAFWILFWFGWNLLFDARGVVLIEASVLLLFYDKLNLRRAREAPRADLAVRSSWEPIRSVVTGHRERLR